MKAHTVAIASDHAGFELKELVKSQLVQMGLPIHDLGPSDESSVDYPDYANALASWLKEHDGSAGVLICGSGIGMSMAANRHRDIRAALCHDGLSASLARRHNNANVLCLGARLIGIEVAKDCLKHFFTTEFEGGRHEGRVAKLSQKFKRNT